MRITRKEQIMKKRNSLILNCWNEGFLLDEIAEMFGLKKARISQIIIGESKGRKSKKK